MRLCRFDCPSWLPVLPLLVGLSLLLGDALAPKISRSEASRPPVSTPVEPPRLGVVWTPASRPDSALAELNRIDDTGASAVRVTRLPSDTVAGRADTLGIHLYVDLPITYVSASRLPDTLAQMKDTANRLRTLARRHPSITHVGLGHAVDTTLPTACKALRRWTDRVHQWPPSLRTYYVTPFSAGPDRCADAVDRPLLDVRALPAPVDRWEEWQSQSASVGLGAVGTWMQPSAPSGLRNPHSPERQARYLERTLSRLLDSTQTSPPVVFISRWQDRSSPLLPSRRYGLHDTEGTARPAASVVRGFYTGTQRVFAFPSGPEPFTRPYGVMLLGWGLVALLGGLYARSLFVRQTTARYFTAPGFYRDALRESRDLDPGTNGLLLGVVAAVLGTTGTRAAQLAASQPGTDRLIEALPRHIGRVVARGIEHPTTTGLLIGGGVLGLLLLWMIALVLGARWWTRFSFAQGLVLVVWPCWPVLLALPIALIAESGALVSPSVFGLMLLGGGGLTIVSVTGRVLFDYWSVTGLPGLALLPLSILSPFVLTTAAVALLVWHYEVPLRFLWHLVTQT